MQYAFSFATQALLALGKLEQVRTKAGILLPLVRDPATGRFVEIAKVVTNFSAQSLVAPAQLVFAPLQMLQNHLGFQGVNRRVEGVSQQVEGVSQQVANLSDLTLKGLQSLQANIGILQASTAVIGVATVAGVALSAANLYQTLKLREDVKQLRLEVKDGFIDLKQAFKNQGFEILQHIDQVAQDVEFRHHRTILAQAYGRFLEATQLIKSSLSCQDIGIRNTDLGNARQSLSHALADYKNQRILSDTCAAGQLRRMECAWAIEQTIAWTYQLQNEASAVSDRLSDLEAKIRQDSLTVVENCQTEDELDFIFPEIKRIHDQDLTILNNWKNHVDWMRSLSPSELKLLQSTDFSNSEITITTDENPTTTSLDLPHEQIFYEQIKEKSHQASLLDQLRLMMKPNLRQEYTFYISQQATNTGYKTLVSANLEKASDLTIANLYWYFKVREESEAQPVFA